MEEDKMNRDKYNECVDAIYESMEGVSWTDTTLFNTYYFILGLQELIGKYGDEMDKELKLHIQTVINYFVKSQIENHTMKKIESREFKGYYGECLIGDWLESAHSTLLR